MFRKKLPPNPTPKGAGGYRAYVVGDVHGRLDLLDQLLAAIHAELDSEPECRAVLVFVGDLIDRGPDSAGVVELLRTYKRPGVRLVVLLGNHEEVLLRILDGDCSLIDSWLSFGGAECLASYGVEADTLAPLGARGAMKVIADSIPAAHSRFLAECADSFRFGDYLIVHAGIRPGVQIERQLQSDLRWIREPFLADPSDHGFVVVHGHTISAEVEVRPNRIGIDTGAYASGRLTALVIDGAERRFLATGGMPSRVFSPAAAS